VLRTHGYSGASTNRIARAAGVSVGSLYQYFGDKDGLIGAALERALAREGEILARLADDARPRPVSEGVAVVVGSVVRSRIGQRALLAVLAEHGLRFGPGTTVQVVLRHQRGHPDPLQRLLAGRRAELRRDALEVLCFSASALLQSASFGYAVTPSNVRAEVLVDLLAGAIADHLTEETGAAPADAPVARVDVARMRPLLNDACRSANARAALLDELVYEEQLSLDALCAAGREPEAVCGGLLRFWSESARHLAQAAGASSLTGPGLEPEAWKLRAERRSRRVRSWLASLHGGPAGEGIDAAIFVLGHAFLELGLLFAQSREPAEVVEAHLASAAALLGRVARRAGGLPLAAAAARE
jgi:AcrR family transcriptional regulator